MRQLCHPRAYVLCTPQSFHINVHPLPPAPPYFNLPLPCSSHPLRQILRRIALIRAYNLPTNQLLIRIRRINNRPPLHHRQRLEPIPSPKLPAPVAADGEGATLDIVVACAGSGISAYGVGAGCGSGAGVGVDAVGVFAGCVCGVAGPDEGFYGPLRGGGGHHGDVGDWSWGGEGGGDGREGGEEDG